MSTPYVDTTTENNNVEYEEDEHLIVFTNEDVEEGIQECSNILVGRLVSEKNINSAWIYSAMHNIWRKPEGMRIVELRPKFYQIFFNKEGDLKNVLKGSPWSFKNSWLILKRWDRREESIEKSLDTKALEDEKEGKSCSKDLGAWLRAEMVGTLVRKERRNDAEGGDRGDKEEERGKERKATEKLLQKLKQLTVTAEERTWEENKVGGIELIFDITSSYPEREKEVHSSKVNTKNQEPEMHIVKGKGTIMRQRRKRMGISADQ
ncbi:hypothetical protein PIB30_089865 [Stylosanthes scabra]|uniref:DUF4283 domain-containing protein n=1 Tax=Stylosanthes scabra TaxID=79078 RepID=A0ABU6WSI2_9FABA|nr:hypothetical protein [Stylosanthes scabra]